MTIAADHCIGESNRPLTVMHPR